VEECLKNGTDNGWKAGRIDVSAEFETSAWLTGELGSVVTTAGSEKFTLNGVDVSLSPTTQLVGKDGKPITDGSTGAQRTAFLANYLNNIKSGASQAILSVDMAPVVPPTQPETWAARKITVSDIIYKTVTINGQDVQILETILSQ